MGVQEIRLRIETVNAAFDDHVRSETARILQAADRKFADEVCDLPLILRDINGNRVGEMTAILR